MEFPRVWDESRPSIYCFIRQSFPDDDSINPLPDDEVVNRDKGIRWVAGAMDGAFGHHGDTRQVGPARAILTAVTEAVRGPNSDKLERLYGLLVEDSIIGFIDPFLSLLSEDPIGALSELPLLARWLAMEAPDRGAVKFGLALLGHCGDFRDQEIFLTLGRHEEFTLYAAVALTNTLPEPELALWDLAKHVHGWGRIQLVERLAATGNPAIKDWMLREGYKNKIMYEYLAHCCATAGGLRSALQPPEPDSALMDGAGDIIEALIFGGPAEDIGHYQDGAEVIRLYLEHLSRQPLTDIRRFGVVQSIQQLVENSQAKPSRAEALGWPEDVRLPIALAASAVLSRDEWPRLAHEALQSQDGFVFGRAASALETLGQDPWEVRFERQRDGSLDQWYYLLKTDDVERVKRVIALAEEHISLKDIAAGPGRELGLGPEFKQNKILEWVVQELPRFPGTGWPFVVAGLRSPVIRTRNMALRVLGAWPRNVWPPEAHPLLERALAEEPDARVDQHIRDVIVGRPRSAGVVVASKAVH
jgi:hypothetical protein